MMKLIRAKSVKLFLALAPATSFTTAPSAVCSGNFYVVTDTTGMPPAPGLNTAAGIKLSDEKLCLLLASNACFTHTKIHLVLISHELIK